MRYKRKHTEYLGPGILTVTISTINVPLTNQVPCLGPIAEGGSPLETNKSSQSPTTDAQKDVELDGVCMEA